VKVVKNKVAAPFRQAEFDIEYGDGISNESCLLDLGVEHDIVTKSGSFFSYGDQRLGQGKNNVKAFLAENIEVADEIEDKIYEALDMTRVKGPKPVPYVPIEEAEGAEEAPTASADEPDEEEKAA
jgi:recombination protein RecA